MLYACVYVYMYVCVCYAFPCSPVLLAGLCVEWGNGTVRDRSIRRIRAGLRLLLTEGKLLYKVHIYIRRGFTTGEIPFPAFELGSRLLIPKSEPIVLDSSRRFFVRCVTYLCGLTFCIS